MKPFKSKTIPVRNGDYLTYLEKDNWAVTLQNGETLYGFISEDQVYEALRKQTGKGFLKSW